MKTVRCVSWGYVELITPIQSINNIDNLKEYCLDWTTLDITSYTFEFMQRRYWIIYVTDVKLLF